MGHAWENQCFSSKDHFLKLLGNLDLLKRSHTLDL